MEYITLKNSDMRVSRLCMGGCPMGGYGWGDVQERELMDAVHVALENGITFFDTADIYGLGQSEKILGKALGKRRKDVVVADKFGVRVAQGKTVYDNSPDYIRQALDASLERLGTDYIDLYQPHYYDENTPLDEIIVTLEELKEKGKIRYYGLSNIHKENYDEIRPFIGKIVSIQDEYSLACRKNETELMRFSSEFKVTPMTWGSLGQGILTGKYDKNAAFGNNDRRHKDIYVNFHGDKLLKNLEIVETMKPIAGAHNKPVSAIAIRFIMDLLMDSVVLVGAKRPGQILGNIEGCDWNLTEEEMRVLDTVSRNNRILEELK